MTKTKLNSLVIMFCTSITKCETFRISQNMLYYTSPVVITRKPSIPPLNTAPITQLAQAESPEEAAAPAAAPAEEESLFSLIGGLVGDQVTPPTAGTVI